MKDITEFRKWVYELWEENCAEREAYGEDRRDVNKYFHKYKWWLKREYKFQKDNK